MGKRLRRKRCGVAARGGRRGQGLGLTGGESGGGVPLTGHTGVAWCGPGALLLRTQKRRSWRQVQAWWKEWGLQKLSGWSPYLGVGGACENSACLQPCLLGLDTLLVMSIRKAAVEHVLVEP